MSGLTEFFPIFRAGTHTGANGRTVTFSGGDLDDIVERYDAANPAPCVINHDELYSPFAYAQVAEIKNDNGVLMARCDADSVEPKFAALVENKNLFNRSVQLLPVEDGWRLGHVAFLGAEPPAVQGLAPIQMSAVGVTFSADDAWARVSEAHGIAAIWAVLKKITDKVFGADGAENPVSDFDLQEAQRRIGRAQKEAETETDKEQGGVMNYSQEQLDAAARRAAAEAVAAEKKKFAAERAEFAAAQKRSRLAEIQTRIDGLLADGRLLPAQAPGLAEFALRLHGAEAFEFTRPTGEDGNAAVEKARPAEFVFSLLEKMPRQVELGREVGGEDVGKKFAVDLDSAQSIHDAALAFQKSKADAGIKIPFAAAVQTVVAQANEKN